MLSMLLTACVHSGGKLPTAQPRVPRLQSAHYERVEIAPRDPLVARVYDGVLDEALAGAAGAVAIGLAAGRPVGAPEVRWRAVLAGYPWPVAVARVAVVEQDAVAQDLVDAAVAARGHDVGLVRARGEHGDHWVLLVGGRRGELPQVPREPVPGQELALPGFAWSAVAPSGAALTGQDRLTVSMPGEWLVQLRDSQGIVTTFPLYAGRTTPQGPPFRSGLGAEVAGDLDEELLWQLDALDGWYERSAAERDLALDAVARGRLRSFLAGQALPPAGQQLAAAGYFEGTAGECRAASVSDCLDAMWWSQSGHAALAGAWGTVGMAVTPTAEGVAISVAVADRE